MHNGTIATVRNQNGTYGKRTLDWLDTHQLLHAFDLGQVPADKLK